MRGDCRLLVFVLGGRRGNHVKFCNDLVSFLDVESKRFERWVNYGVCLVEAFLVGDSLQVLN
jgi:hypothetical protein